jgi:hypothetical protein
MSAWTVTVYPSREREGFFKVTAISADRGRVIHKDRLTAEQAAAFVPEWERPAPATPDLSVLA